MWLHRLGMSWRAITGDSGSVPADHAALQLASLTRIAGKMAYWEVQRSCLIFADQTFLNLGPHMECAVYATGLMM